MARKPLSLQSTVVQPALAPSTHQTEPGVAPGQSAFIRTDTPSLGQELAGGLITGLNKQPFLSPLISEIASMGGFSDASLRDLDVQMEGSTPAQAVSMIANHGPSLVGGVKIYNVASKLGTKGMQALATGIAKRKGIKDFREAATPTGLLQNQMFRIGAKAQDEKALASTLQGIRTGAARQKLAPDLVQRTPGLQRVGEIAASNTALGTFVAGEELGRGKSVEQALQSAGIAAILGVGIDGTLTGVARLAIPRARSALTKNLQENFHNPTIELTKRDASRLGVDAAEKISPAARVKLEVEAGVKELALKNQKLQTFLNSKAQAESILRSQTPSKAVSKAQRKLKKESGKIIQETNQIRSQQTGLQAIFESPGSFPYTSESTRIRPVQQMMDGLFGKDRVRFGTAPEALFGDLGVIANKYWSELSTSIRLMEATNRAVTFHGRNLENQARKALGIKKKDWRNMQDGPALLATEAWETGSVQGLKNFAINDLGRTPAQADSLVDAYITFDEMLFDTLIRRGVPGGGKESLFKDGIREGVRQVHRTPNGRVPVDPKRGVVEYSSHSSRDVGAWATRPEATKAIETHLPFMFP